MSDQPETLKEGYKEGYEYGINFMLKVRQWMEKILKRDKNVQPTKEI